VGLVVDTSATACLKTVVFEVTC